MPILKPDVLIHAHGYINTANGKKLHKWEWDGPEDGIAAVLPEKLNWVLLRSPWELEVIEDQTFVLEGDQHVLVKRQLVC